MLNLSHLPPLGLSLVLIEFSGLIIIDSSSDISSSSLLSESSITISSARISIVPSVGYVAGVIG